MARKDQVPENLEVWIGHPTGLRLKRHPKLDAAMAWLDEYPMVIRSGPSLGPASCPDGLPKIRVSTLPVFRKSSVGPAVELVIETETPPCPELPFYFGWIELETPETLLIETAVLAPGQRQRFTVPFPEFTEPVTLRASLKLRDHGATENRVRLKPEKRRTIYAVFQTHLDLGWTDRAATVREGLKKMTAETAVRVCSEYADRPAGERFVWTCECSEALALAWEGSGAAEREQLVRFVQSGLIQCCALPFSFHSSMMTAPLLREAMKRSLALRDQLGLPDLDLSVAQQNDVPGYTWTLPDVLHEFGVRRAIIGNNHMVRGCKLPPLFRWRGPGGGEVLTLATTCCDYGTRAIPESPEMFAPLSANAETPLNPPGTALFMNIGSGENCGPEGASRQMRQIAAWNARYEYPKIIVGGPRDFFNHLEPELDYASLPVVDREISDWWIDGVGAAESLPVYVSALRKLPRLAPETAAQREAMNQGIEQLILFSEHTFGLNAQLVKVRAAARNWDISNGFENYILSWRDKNAYADAAARYFDAVPATPAAPPDGIGKWAVESDASGIVRLAAPDGTVWFDRTQTDLAFGLPEQRLMPTDLEEFYHHNPPSAPNAGVRRMTVSGVRRIADGVEISGALDSPAGAIREITVRVWSPGSGELRMRVAWRGKEPTAQSEVLSWPLPVTVPAPEIVIDRDGHEFRPDRDQLPDANRDLHPVLTGYAVHAAGRKLNVDSEDLALWYFGRNRICNFNRRPIPRGGECFALLFDNLWETNFPVWTLRPDHAFEVTWRV